MEPKKIVLLVLAFLAVPIKADTGMAVVVATFDRPGITAALPVTPIYVTTQTGLYRLTGVATITTAGTSGTLCAIATWIDGDSWWTIQNGPPCGGITNVGQGVSMSQSFYAAKGTPVSISTAFNNLVGTPTYSLHFQLEQF